MITDFLIRGFTFIAAGLFLLMANIWFVKTLYNQYWNPEYVIIPFQVLDPGGTVPANAGLAIAQITASRLANLQTQLTSAGKGNSARNSSTPAKDDLFGALSIFVTEPIEIPTTMFKPVEIRATVGGVDVGGVFSSIQNRLNSKRVIAFTTHQIRDKHVLSGDLSEFSESYGTLWLETDSDPGEIATYAAYALLHARLSEDKYSRIGDLDLVSFRKLMETVFAIDAANQQTSFRQVADVALGKLYADLEEQLLSTPNWPELIFLAGSTSLRIGNLGNAISHFRKLATMSDGQREGVNPRIFELAKDHMAELRDSPASPRGRTQEKFANAAAEFAVQMNLPGPDPKIEFVEKNTIPGHLGQWSEKHHHYEVYPEGMKIRGFPQYIALMGRFFERNFDRCFHGAGPRPEMQFWQEFRYAVVDYLIQSNPDFSQVKLVGQTYMLFEVMQKIEFAAGKTAAQRLGLAMLNSFECDWTQDTLEERLLEINKRLGLMDESLITTAMEKAAWQGSR